MNSTLTDILKVFALTLPLGLAACATSSDIKDLSARIDKAQATADEALNKANAAQSTADQATATSMDASRKSDQAVQTANDAKTSADQANEKLNRAFKKSMEK